MAFASIDLRHGVFVLLLEGLGWFQSLWLKTQWGDLLVGSSGAIYLEN